MKEFLWIEFYMELANKLLEYKNDRTLLIEKIKSIYSSIEMKLPTLEKDNNIVDIDPFTIFALFNKGITNSNRTQLLNAFKSVFSISAKVPEEFDGIPVVNNMKATFYNFVGDRDESDLDNLWHLFECAITLYEIDNDTNRTSFISAFDSVINQKGISWNITMGLFWIRPYTYINLDAKNRKLLENNYVRFDTRLNILKLLKKVPDGEMYLNIISSIKEIMTEYNSFPDLSYDAWNQANDDKDKFFGEVELKYWPTLEEYDPGITVEMWKEILNDKSLTSNEMLDIFAKMMKLGGESTCYHMAEVYGKTYSYYNAMGSNFGRRVKERYNLPDCYDSEYDRMRFYTIPFVGRNVGEGNKTHYSWKLRDELKEALEEMDLSVKTERNVEFDKNIILYGPPGTGKTYNTAIYAVAIIENKTLEEVSAEEYSDIYDRYNNYKNEGVIEFTTFHQSYGYEEFIEGIKPVMNGNGDITYEVVSGVFKAFCEKEDSHINKINKVFIVDEINRGNISKILGELITLIEPTKRIGQPEEMQAKLPYSQTNFGVSDNVYIIGTMNTADRSIAAIDTALRRRFSFKEMLPKPDVLLDVEVEGVSISKMLEKINRRIEVLYDREHTVGHAYFMPLVDDNSMEKLAEIFKNKILPLLQEYFYEDYDKIRLVLGDNQKTVEPKFIVKGSVDEIELFGEDTDAVEDAYKYSVNEDAFMSIDAYKKMI